MDDGWIRHSATTREGASTAGVWLCHWPNLALNLYEHGMSVERWLPTSPTTCDARARLLLRRHRRRGGGRNQRDVDASTETCLEDKAICEAVQRNLEAGAYDDGLLVAAPRGRGRRLPGPRPSGSRAV